MRRRSPWAATWRRTDRRTPHNPTIVDFDVPLAPLGPIASNAPYFTAAGVASVDVVGTWTALGDVLNTNVFGRSLTVTNGVLTVSQLDDPMDSPSAGAGFDIRLTADFDEIGVLFTDQTGFTFDVEMFNGATSLGTGSGTFPSSASGIYFRAGSPADRIVLTANPAVGGFGIDDIAFSDGPPPTSVPLPDECVESFYLGGNSGAANGAVYFDLTVTQSVTIDEFFVHYGGVAGTPVGLEVYTTSGTRVGKETNAAAWTLRSLDNGTATSAGNFAATPITLATPFTLSQGTHGIALIAVGSQHFYTNGNGTNQVHTSADGVMTMTAGGATNVPFTGQLFDPRVFNGRICRVGGSSLLGTNYCTATPNSTGVAGVISATGSNVAAVNDVTLTASNLPPGRFGIFVTSLTQDFVPNVGSGNLCVGGMIGRYQQPGQILQADPSGEFSLAIDTTAVPQGTVVVPIPAGQTRNF